MWGLICGCIVAVHSLCLRGSKRAHAVAICWQHSLVSHPHSSLFLSYNIGQLAYLNAKMHGLTRILFGGFYIRAHPYIMETISFAIRFWSKVRATAWLDNVCTLFSLAFSSDLSATFFKFIVSFSSLDSTCAESQSVM